MSSQKIQHLQEEFKYTQEFVAEYLNCSRATSLVGKLKI